MRKQLKARGYMNEVFTFIDASHLIAKANLWEERDKAIKGAVASLVIMSPLVNFAISKE